MQHDLSGEVEIRPTESGDLEAILAIERQSFASPWSRQLFEETIAFPLSVNLVLLLEGKVVAYIDVYVIGDEVHILNIAVHPAHRRKGLASKLIGRLMELLKERGAGQYVLEVREGNSGAIALYRKLGFRVIGRRKRYYTETNEDALVMLLSLEGP